MPASALPAPAVSRLYHHPAARLEDGWAGWFEVREAAQPPADEPGYYLWAAPDHLELRRRGSRHGVWVSVDELERRTAQGIDLLKACGVGGDRLQEALDAVELPPEEALDATDALRTVYSASDEASRALARWALTELDSEVGDLEDLGLAP